MSWKTLLKFIVVAIVLNTAILTAEEEPEPYASPVEKALDNLKPHPGSIVSRRTFDLPQVTELTLSNGMTVVLKPNQGSDNEILIEGFALRGSASLPAAEHVSGVLSPEIAWASGLGELSSSQLSSFHTDYSLELTFRIQPYYRLIEGSLHPKTLSLFFELFHLKLTQQNFDSKVIPEVLEQTRESIKLRKQEFDANYEDLFTEVNTGNIETLRQLTEEDLKKVDFEIARKRYREGFGHPADFTVVIVGKFDVAEIEPLIITYLASIPNESSAAAWPTAETPLLSFPPGTTTDIQFCDSNREALTRLTFPIKVAVDEKSMLSLESSTQAIETRLRNTIRSKLGTTQGVDVSYEFPLYPNMNSGWIIVQFLSNAKIQPKLIQMSLQELKLLQMEGPTDAETQSVKLLMKRMNEFWSQENSYWLAETVNSYIWKHNPAQIGQTKDFIEKLSTSIIHSFLKNAYSTEHYSVISKQCHH